MEAAKIMNANFLDILFDGKNKDYGAYELRKTYNNRVTWAMIGMLVICLLFFFSNIFGNNTGKVKRPIFVDELTLDKLKKIEEKSIKLPPVQQVKTETRVEMKKFTTIVITEDDKVTDLPPAVETLDAVKIGANNVEGTRDIGLAAPPVEQSTGVVEGLKKVEVDYNKPFTKVEKEARFPGGMEGWKKYLERNLNANVAADDGATSGNYTVKVQFIVDKQGGISDVQAIDIPKACPACGPEAVRVIKKGPKWEPAIQNGREVIYQAVQFITFQVAAE